MKGGPHFLRRSVKQVLSIDICHILCQSSFDPLGITMVSSGRRPSFLLTLLWTIPTPCHSIQPSSTIKGSEYSLHNCKRLEPSQPEPISRSRRIFLSSAASASFSMPPMGATAVESIDCLSDLPPLADNHVRIFLCRHGQTENNRLKRLYGDGSNPPLNQVGERQAELLGQALLHASTPPSVPFFHSPLKRAQQTAEIASSTLNQVPSTRLITSLREVDFGGFVEGKPAQLIRAKLTATYSAWAIGELDVRAVGDGENGRQVSGSYCIRLSCVYLSNNLSPLDQN